MPSQLHEALVHLFRARPTLAVELLEVALGVSLPAYAETRIAESEVADAAPITHRADLVITLGDSDHVELAIIVEVQLRIDARKKRTWPRYLTALGAELDSKAIVLVVTPDTTVQRWAAAPIAVGIGNNVITPFVLGPDDIPRVEAHIADARPELAVLSAIARGDQADATQVARVALRAVARLDEDVAATYTDFVLNALSVAARAELEREMREANYFQRTDHVKRWFARGREEGRQEGRQEGLASALIAILEARGLELDEELRVRVLSCRDGALLDRWLAAAAQAERLEDVFGDA